MIKNYMHKFDLVQYSLRTVSGQVVDTSILYINILYTIVVLCN